MSSAATRPESPAGRLMLMVSWPEHHYTFCAGGFCQSAVERGERELFQKRKGEVGSVVGTETMSSAQTHHLRVVAGPGESQW